MMQKVSTVVALIIFTTPILLTDYDFIFPLLLGFLFGFLYRSLLKHIAKGSVRGATKNIKTRGRLMRFIIAIALIIWAALTSWSPVLLFFAGFCLFEAIFSWCGFYAAIGKSECPL